MYLPEAAITAVRADGTQLRHLWPVRRGPQTVLGGQYGKQALPVKPVSHPQWRASTSYCRSAPMNGTKDVGRTHHTQPRIFCYGCRDRCGCGRRRARCPDGCSKSHRAPPGGRSQGAPPVEASGQDCCLRQARPQNFARARYALIRRSRDDCPVIHSMGDEHTTCNPRLSYGGSGSRSRASGGRLGRLTGGAPRP